MEQAARWPGLLSARPLEPVTGQAPLSAPAIDLSRCSDAARQSSKSIAGRPRSNGYSAAQLSRQTRVMRLHACLVLSACITRLGSSPCPDERVGSAAQAWGARAGGLSGPGIHEVSCTACYL